MSGRVYLFDVDATLVRTGGVGSRSLSAAFEACFGTPDVTRGVRFHGRTDRGLARELLARAAHGTTGDVAADTRTLFEAYLPRLERALADGAEYEILPGVVPLLSSLAARGDVLGLATGNVAHGARLKLARGDLWRFFPFGGFGDDAEERAELVATARRRAEAATGRRLADHEVFVIGDSELDVQAAHAARCRSVAVGTGATPESELRAAGAEFYFPTLEGALSDDPFR